MGDFQSIIEFCRAYDHNHKTTNMKNSKSCEHSHSPFAVIDAVMMLLSFIALCVLAFSYCKILLSNAYHLLPFIYAVTQDVMFQIPLVYAAGLALFIVVVVVAWEWFSFQARKCGNPHCRGLKKAAEFDIQLESEECIKRLPPAAEDGSGSEMVELGEDYKELEVELKRMAPVNGRTVLVFRSPCGCPARRMEVWGQKKIRRIKK